MTPPSSSEESAVGARPATTADPARRIRASTEEAVRYVEQLIFNGTLSAGDSLPSEAEMAAAVGVSRLTIREGIRSLQARGLLTVIHGRRSVVAAANSRPLRDFFAAHVRRDAGGALELLDLRLAIEVRAAEMAAGRAGAEHRADLEAAMAAMVAAGEDAHGTGDVRERAFNDADVRFHAAVAAASGNRALALLLEGMEGPLQQSRLLCARGYRLQPGERSLVQQHQDVLDRVLAGDPEGAAAAMRDHLHRTRDYLLLASAARSPDASE